MASWQRTHTCGELRESHVGQTVTLNGWVQTFRDHRAFVFVDLRDRYGKTQVLFDPDAGKELFELGRGLRSEVVVSVTGVVAKRLQINPDMPTGDIEIKAQSLKILNDCPRPPFEVTEFDADDLAHEELRLQYRYLDLRRPSLQQKLMMRHRLCATIRDHLDQVGFLEVETPLLGRSTPEGARDYLVPSRVHPGNWYALPQSPQIYKQLLMIAGIDKYFQIARCLRDEDLRADRQPEFTQLDMEMSFVEMDDVFQVMEKLIADVFQRCIDVAIPTPFPKLRYEDCMLRFGTDKPDLRYALEIIEATDLVEMTQFKVFQQAKANGGRVRGLNAKSAAERYSRKGIEELESYVKQFGAKGLAWIKVEADKFTSPIEKFLPAEAQQAVRERFQAQPGDLLLFIADQESTVCQALGNLRAHLALQLKLYDPAKPDYQVAWAVDFPLFGWDDEEKRWVSNHHPFTSPMDEDITRLESDPGSVRAKAYDLIINGYEVGGGSIRIHNPELQERVFGVLGMTPDQARQRFGFLLDALKFGAPPHGGIAFGVDRWAMLLSRTTNIRDVIAFPKNQKARDLMTGAPAAVDAKQLKELGLNTPRGQE